LGVDLDKTAFWAIFTTLRGGTLYAQTNVGGIQRQTPLGSASLGGMHLFRIDRGTSSVTYWIDGQQVASAAASITRAMRPIFNDSASGAGTLAVDWVALSPYASTGSFVSRVLDAGGSTAWSAATWDANVPAGTTLTVQTRTGDTAAPDSSWSAWAALTNGAAVASPPGRYLQYRVLLTTNNPNLTSVLYDITFTWVS
jgi:hypothetical protein